MTTLKQNDVLYVCDKFNMSISKSPKLIKEYLEIAEAAFIYPAPKWGER